jgi:hypothetical protein
MRETRSSDRRGLEVGAARSLNWLRIPVSRRAFAFGAAGLVLGACTRRDAEPGAGVGGGPAPTEDVLTPTVEPTVTSTPTPEPTATPVPDPTPTPEPAPTATLIPEPTPTPSPEPAGTPFEALLRQESWLPAVHTAHGQIIGRVTTEMLNIRTEPRLDASIANTTFARHTLIISDVVDGDPVNEDSRWFRVGTDQYVTAAFVEPFIAPEIEHGYQGRWLDVNLTGFYAIGYDGTLPRYAAIITAGRGERTPKGVFEILYRVRSETMDSETVGIPPGDPEYYYLENVEYSQYFKYGGYAVHGNYWTAPHNFGAFSSNGCVGLMNKDAAWFWEFLEVGSTVSVHF